MNRDRRTRTLRACRPRQGARRIGGAWAVDDRWKGIATVPRSVAADSLLDFGVLFGATEGPSEPRIVVRGDEEPVEQTPDGENG
ncbi:MULTISPECIES: hypothetical protein [Nocardia]|uniref:Uncharacterized protein n=1 Tax=Nocardia vulneris TaxID=1141657 RepID=A0ABR4ZBL7_9NOCA|nr:MULTISPECIES: hypothetical protein [Nocardia]ASF11352.1 hypothetical protein CEQ30_32920 [Nocardia brasiliensis]KIA62742.1 hypothetical protein FG87_23960 [Nocardia vulneris]MBF6131232.1 hypothetical protein [Nocardia brasiliensis]MBF6545983.1 hypothetical protein [Nocardia brasiliensis]SUB09914.1 Uncharacterised protein [Nocardia brasiliensis]